MKGKLLFSLGFLLIFALDSCNASNSLQRFVERYNEVKNDGSVNNSSAWGNYAASSVSLQRFTERYNEVKNDDSVNNSSAWGDYAGS
jgi:hypothetical protein